ncbi:unnamed protein product [Sympodiomycopsis kandeliae]
MSEWVPKDRPQPIRILALHGYPSQSAASYRALLAPLIQSLPSWYEFHFLEADFPVLSTDGEDRENEESRKIKNTILKCATLVALQGRLKSSKVRREMRGEDQDSGGEQKTEDEISKLRSELSNDTDPIVKSVWKEFSSISSGDGVAGLDVSETLLAKNGYLPMDRNWLLPSRTSIVGLEVSIQKLATYIREYGPFHGGIGSGSGYYLLRLLSTLLTNQNHHETVYQFPLMFPLLPKDMPLPRMGGWEVMPSVSLPSGRRRAVVQDGLLFTIQIGTRSDGNGMGQKEEEMLRDVTKEQQDKIDGQQNHKSLLILPSGPSLSDPKQEQSHTIAISSPSSQSKLFSRGITNYTSSYIRSICIHAESVPGLNPFERKQQNMDNGQGGNGDREDEVVVHWDRTADKSRL